MGIVNVICCLYLAFVSQKSPPSEIVKNFTIMLQCHPTFMMAL